MEKILAGVMDGEDNDWEETKDGFVQLEYDLAMLTQQINARIQTLPNEVDGFEGVDYWNIIFGRTSLAVKANAIITAIKTIPLVEEAVWVGAEWVDKKAGSIKFSFFVTTQLGDIKFIMNLDKSKQLVVVE